MVRQLCGGVEQTTEDDSDKPVGTCIGTTTLQEDQKYSVDYQIIKQGQQLKVNLMQVRNKAGIVPQQLKASNIKLSYDEYASMVIYGGKATKTWNNVKENALSFALTLNADN
ncbi:MAG: hypothetical protein QM751_00990 [Paludibacteraceae bacterium]